MTMRTQDYLDRFLEKCKERGLSPATREHYNGYLRHFLDEFPLPPYDTISIERFLRRRKEPKGKRGHWYKVIQAFFSYLEEFEGIPRPECFTGKVGRPRKKEIVTNPALPTHEIPYNSNQKELVTGGQSVLTSTFISTREAIDRYLGVKKVEGVTPVTLRCYSAVLLHFACMYPRLPISEEDINKYLASVQGVYETRYTRYIYLKIFFRFLEKKKIAPNVMADIRMRLPKEKIRITLTTEELQRLLALPKPPRDRIIFDLLVQTQIRADELCSLDRERVFPDHIVINGKNGQRIVPISTATYKELCSLAASGPLFCNVHGRIKPRYLYTIVRKYLGVLGVKGMKMGPHLLRHSGAVQYLMFGGDTESLQQILGHSNPKTTHIYARMSSEQVKQRHSEVDLLGKLTPEEVNREGG